MKKILFLFFIFTVPAIFFAAELDNYLLISPQLKYGKIENGNYFLEAQFMKFNWHVDQKMSIEGGLSTGFTASRDGAGRMNHAVNRMGVKLIYRPFDSLGFFVEGNYAQKIKGASNDVSYFMYENFQAVGVQLDIAKFKFK